MKCDEYIVLAFYSFHRVECH